MPRPQLRASAWVCLLCSLLCAAGLTLGLYRLSSRKWYASDPRLNRAAHALIGERARERLQAQEKALGLPVGAYFGRQRAVQLALELARLRPEVADLAGAAEEQQEVAAARVAGASAFVGARLASYLRIDEARAQVVLYGLGWPWVGSDPRLVTAADMPARQDSWPPPLRGILLSERRRLLELAEEAPGWPLARRRLDEEFGLTYEQISAIRCKAVHEALNSAFDSVAGTERAADALAKYADLAPIQIEAVLAVRATLELLHAGPAAAEALDALSRDHPHLAEPIRDAGATGT